VLKPSLLISIATLAVAAVLGAAPPASAKTPCWQVVISDWYENGRIDKTYPIPCYEQAIHHLPVDVQSYADAASEINRAMLDQMRRDRNGTDQPSGHGKKKTAPTFATSPGGEPPKGFFSKLIDKIGPSSADSVPLPLLVLAGIALLLLAAAGGSWVARRIQARRVMPQPAPAEGPRDRR
jgi:hypothetical protein